MSGEQESSNERVCTCAPDFRPLTCQHRYAWSECMREERAHLIHQIERLRAQLEVEIQEATKLARELGRVKTFVESLGKHDELYARLADETTGEHS
jgi:hypothetical protein